jgi:hypothetical protein
VRLVRCNSLRQARQSARCPQQSGRRDPGFQASTATQSRDFTRCRYLPLSCLTHRQVLSFDPANTLVQAELARLDTPAAAHHAPTAAPATVLAKSAASTAAPPSSSVSRNTPASSSTAAPQKEAPAKMTAFKPGFLNADPSAPKPRRIQIKEDSDESDPEPDSDPPPSAAAATAQAPASAAVHNTVAPVKPSHAAVAAAAAAAVAVTDEDIVARAVRIASMNVTQPRPEFRHAV